MMKKLRNTFFIFALSVSMAFSQTIPDFTMVDTHGETHQLYADYLDQGKTVVFEFFWVNCGNCQNLAPHMQELYMDWGEGQHDVEFFGITIMAGDSDDKVQGYDNQFGITYPSISADGGSLDVFEPFEDDDFGFYEGTPSVAVISPDGTVQFDIFGGVPSYIIPAVETQIIDSGATHPSEITSVDEPVETLEELVVSPNPVRDFTSISFNLNEPAEVDIQVINIIGQTVINAFEGNKFPGYHQVEINAERLPSGTYFIKMTANDVIQTMRFVKVRRP